jgi:hypothetical protein
MRRRSLLGAGLVGGAVLALGGGAALWWHEPAWRDARLLPAGRAVMGAVASAMLDGSLPEPPALREAALDAHLLRLQEAIAVLPAPTQREIAQLLALMALPAGRLALAGLRNAWPDASLPDLQTSLQSMRESSLTLRRQVYAALHELTHAAYFADAGTWPLLGYPGPRALV